tara:strand:+ start:1849 stop:2622 length:774 start_codon:yes stop_codon:yes gene_type:complete
MHGIGLSAARYDTFYPYNPIDVGGGTLSLWLKDSTDIIDESGNVSPNLVDNIRITKWLDSSGNSNHAIQETQADMPRWEEDDNSVNFANQVKFMDLTSNVSVGASRAFTVMTHINFQAINDDSLCGSGTDDFIRFVDTNSIRVLIGDSTANDFNESTFEFEVDRWYFVTVCREVLNGNLNIYVKYDHVTNGGSSVAELDFGLPHGHSDTDAFVINNIGCEGDDVNPLKARMKTFFIWNGYRLTNTDRDNAYNYLMGI